MKGVNKVIIIGTLGDDPTIRYSQNGMAMASLSIATSETWKDKQTGNQESKTEWHKVVLWKRLAELAGEYLKKGSKVYIEGKLQTRSWQDQSGQKKYITEIVGQQMQFLDSRVKSAQQPVDYPRNNGTQQAADYLPQQDFDDGIPF